MRVVNLAISTPFEGKAWALDRWLGALHAANLPEGTQLIWLCNSPDPEFFARLTAAAKAMPWPVTLWRDAERATVGDIKDRTVSYLWRELRKRIPVETERVFCLEDDVLLGTGTVEVLLALSAEHGPLTVVAAPTPCRVGHVGSPEGVWVDDSGRVDGWTVAPRTRETDFADSAAFGATMFPRALFERLPLTSDPRARPYWGYDTYAGECVRNMGGTILAAWEARVDHMEHPTISDPCTQRHPRDLDDFRAGNTDPRQNDRHHEARKRRGHGSHTRRTWRGIRP